MEVWRDGEAFPRPDAGSVVTIGEYDGVHLGHRELIGEVRRRADAQQRQSVVLTFDRHPAAVVRPQSVPKLLTDLEQKLELLAQTGVDATFVIRFDEARSKERAEEFVRELLVGALHVKDVVVGKDFHFGHRRRGNVTLLAQMGGALGFGVTGIDLVPVPGQGIVSSTVIRQALVEGDIAGANAMLGRDHEVRGIVGHGDHRARELGFRTANVAVPDEIQLPSDGIYAGWYERSDGGVHAAALSLGRRPTFYEHADTSLLEAHLLGGFSADLYGEAAKVRFVERLRDEVKFESVDDLVAQMDRDCDQAREVLRA
jgi:riboflavin kinase/FMN adenylyltransferase